MNRDKGKKKLVSKKVLTLIEGLQRRQGIRELEERYLIVCEDTKSAPSYFRAFIKRVKLSATSVEVAGSGHSTQPIQVVNRAIELKMKAADPESGTDEFKHVWCVIDGDFGPAKIKVARNKAKASSVELAVSNKCFEYWVLLHFEEYDTSTNDCNGLVNRLRKEHIPNYEKGKCQFHEIAKHAAVACKRAEKTRNLGIGRGDLPEVQNPCSEIYRLVNKLLTASSI